MLRYMLDTNICIHVLRAEASSRLAGRFNRYAEQLCMSTVTLAELHFGAENSRHVAENLNEVEQFTGRLEAVLDFDADAAADFGRIRVALKRSPIGPYDAMIAAHARSRNLVVVTDNENEFARVPGLQIENWIR